jgi:hypothetical protein
MQGNQLVSFGALVFTVAPSFPRLAWLFVGSGESSSSTDARLYCPAMDKVAAAAAALRDRAVSAKTLDTTSVVRRALFIPDCPLSIRRDLASGAGADSCSTGGRLYWLLMAWLAAAAAALRARGAPIGVRGVVRLAKFTSYRWWSCWRTW